MKEIPKNPKNTGIERTAAIINNIPPICLSEINEPSINAGKAKKITLCR